MAHADYECCAICDSKVYYSNDAGSKEIICSSCVANMAEHGVILHNVEELKVWMSTEAPEKVIATLDKAGFSVCFYGNEIDELYESRRTMLAPDTATPIEAGEPS